MAGLENLFATDPTLPQVQKTKLPEDVSLWAETATTKLRELYPDSARLAMTVEYQKKDDSSGTAIGAIHVMDDSIKKSLAVPLIIRKFELFPLDVWMDTTTQAVHPLTADTFKDVFFSPETSAGLDARPTDATGTYFNDPSTWTSTYPPLQGRYSYASAGYTLLDAIADTLLEKDLAVLRKQASDEQTFSLFHKHGHSDLLKKLAAKKGKLEANSNNFMEAALKLIPISAASIKRDGGDKYSILSAFDKMFDLSQSEPMSRSDCANFMSKLTANPQAFMNEVDQEGERMCLMPTAPKSSVFLVDDARAEPVAATDFAVYNVKTKTGLGVDGVILPQVVTFAGKPTGTKIFVGAEHSAYQASFAGVQLTNSDKFVKLLEPRAARVGQTGTFVYLDDGKAIATEPVTIKSVVEYGPLKAFTLSGRKITISRGYAQGESAPSAPNKSKAKVLDFHGMIEQRPDEYVIPNKMVWIPLEGFGELSSTPNEWLMKEAASHMEAQPLVIRWNGFDEFHLSGLDLEKQARSERELKVMLGARGASLEKIAQIVKKAKAVGKCDVHGLARAEKKASIVKEASFKHAFYTQCAALLHRDFIKMAAPFDDKATVDALLALNFINPDNVAKFVSYKPLFYKVKDYLAELLLASRLGMESIPESATVIAMSKMEELCEGLQKLESALKTPAVKTAAAAKPGAKPAAPAAKEQPAAADLHNVHFANGMKDGELGLHLYLEAAKTPTDMLAYMNGKRLAEQNRTIAQMSMGEGVKPAKGAKPPGRSVQSK